MLYFARPNKCNSFYVLVMLQLLYGISRVHPPLSRIKHIYTFVELMRMLSEVNARALFDIRISIPHPQRHTRHNTLGMQSKWLFKVRCPHKMTAIQLLYTKHIMRHIVLCGWFSIKYIYMWFPIIANITIYVHFESATTRASWGHINLHTFLYSCTVCLTNIIYYFVSFRGLFVLQSTKESDWARDQSMMISGGMNWQYKINNNKSI